MRAALYIRVSSDEQRKKGFSLQEQQRVLMEHAEKENLQVVDIYADEGISASKKPHRRHEFQRMLRDIEAGLIDIILFIKLDRWFRNVGDYYRTQEILDRNGVVWQAVTEDYDTSTRSGKLNLNIKLSIAEDEAANASERVKFVFAGKLANKEPITGTLPFGYKIEKIDGVKRIVKDPATQEEAEDMFNYFFKTLSSYKTTKYINAKYGRNLSDTTIARRLKTLAYTGEYKGISDYFPAYITHEQHADVLRQFSRSTRTAKGRKVYLFAGMIKCPECGMYLASCTSNKKTLGYRCRYHALDQCGFVPIIKEEDVEAFLLENIAKEMDAYMFKTTVKKKTTKKESPQQYEKQLERLNNVYVMGNISDEEYALQSAELKAKIADLRAERKSKDAIPQEVRKLLADVNFSSIYGELSREDKRLLWQSCIEEIKCEGRYPTGIVFIE